MATLAIEVLKPDPKNPRTISDAALAGLSVSMEELGDLAGIVFNERSGNLVCGHQRVKTLTAAGAKEWTRKGDAGWIEHPGTGERFAVRIVNWDDTTERLANLAANNPAIQGEFTRDALDQLAEMESHVRFEALGLDALQKQLQAELDAAESEAAGGGGAGDGSPSLTDRFGVPPFSVLDARQGYWQDRKRAWLALGIKSELGRGGQLLSLSDSTEAYRNGEGAYAKRKAGE